MSTVLTADDTHVPHFVETTAELLSLCIKLKSRITLR